MEHPITTYRRRIDMTQAEFATLISRTPSAVSRWEAGLRQPGFFDLMRIRRLTGGEVTADDLVTWWTAR